MATPLDLPLPYNTDAEEAVLGSGMLDPIVVRELKSYLLPEHFYREKHLWVWEAMLRLDDRDEAIDQVTLADELERMGRLADVGGHAALSKILLRVPTAIHAHHYARIVERNAVLRSVIAAAEKMARLAYEETDREIAELYQEIGRITGEIMQVSLDQHYQEPRQYTSGSTEYLTRLREGLVIPAIPMALPVMDAHLDGWRRGWTYTLAARTSVGKTSFALNELLNMSLIALPNGGGYRGVYCSAEMYNHEVTLRLKANVVNTDLQQLLRGFKEGDNASSDDLTAQYPWRARSWDELLERSAQADAILEDAPGTILLYGPEVRGGHVFRPDLSVTGICAGVVGLARKQPLDFIVIDYLTLLDGITDGDTARAALALGQAVQRFRKLGQMLGAATLILTQLKEEASKVRYPNHLLFERSKKIGDDSDVAGTIIKPMDQPRTQEELASARSYLPEEREILVSKHRHGETVLFQGIQFNGATQRWVEPRCEPQSLVAPRRFVPPSRRQGTLHSPERLKALELTHLDNLAC